MAYINTVEFTTLQWLLWLALVALPGLLAALHALFHKRDPRSAMAWVMLCLAFPLVGSLIYLVFGRNRVRRVARRMMPHGMPLVGPGLQQRRPLPDGVAGHFSGLEYLAQGLTADPLSAGNRVVLLRDGEQAYPAMLAAIGQARKQVLLSTYIFDATGIGEHFIQALADAVARGVEVRVLVDGVGAWYSRPRAVARLRQVGVPAERFNPPRPWSWVACLNLRNHRKILVVDGQQAFTGGINIRNHHLAGVGAPARAEDLHFALTGPVALALARLFVADWRFISQQPVRDPSAMPVATGQSLCRVIEDGPDENLDRLLRLILATVHQSRDRIRIITPYFLPPREIMLALQNAALRGVDVQVLLPEQNNLPFVYWAGRHILTPLLDAGVRVFLYRPTFLHAKLLAVDGSYVQIGSYNLDQRSLRLNFELGVEIHDPAVCQAAEAYYTDKRVEARELTLAELAGRSGPARLRDAVCWLFSPYL